MAAWTAKPDCPAHLRPEVEKTGNSYPEAWRLPPATGEVFDSFDQCEARLQAFAFIDGFVVVRR